MARRSKRRYRSKTCFQQSTDKAQEWFADFWFPSPKVLERHFENAFFFSFVEKVEGLGWFDYNNLTPVEVDWIESRYQKYREDSKPKDGNSGLSLEHIGKVFSLKKKDKAAVLPNEKKTREQITVKQRREKLKKRIQEDKLKEK